MDILFLLITLGALFSLFVFWHFVSDWVFQSQKEALAKAKDRKVRAWHCLKYTAPFAPLLSLFRIRTSSDMFSGPEVDLALGWQFYTALAILFVSHYIIDSYVPVMLWAKYLRRATEFTYVVKPVTLTKEQHEAILRGEGKIVGMGWSDNIVDHVTYPSDEEAFRAFAHTPIGLVLMITMDQLFHIAFLIPTIVVTLWP